MKPNLRVLQSEYTAAGLLSLSQELMLYIVFFTVCADVEWICFRVLAAAWISVCFRLKVVTWPCNLQRLGCLLTLSTLQSSATAARWWLWKDGMVLLWFDWTVEREKDWLCAAVGFLNNSYSWALRHLSSAHVTKSLNFFIKSHTCRQQCSIHVKQCYFDRFCYFSPTKSQRSKRTAVFIYISLPSFKFGHD